MFILLLALLACDEPPDGGQTAEGVWIKLRPPPGVEGVECWTWQSAYYRTNTSIGGPECFPVKVE